MNVALEAVRRCGGRYDAAFLGVVDSLSPHHWHMVTFAFSYSTSVLGLLASASMSRRPLEEGCTVSLGDRVLSGALMLASASTILVWLMSVESGRQQPRTE